MTAPSGIPLSALQFWGTARGSVGARQSTAEYWQALRDAAAAFPGDTAIPDFATANQLRSAAVSIRNAGDQFRRSPDVNSIDAAQIGRVPYGRSLEAQAAVPIYHVGITLHTADPQTGETTSTYRMVQFTGSLPASKGELLTVVGQDAEALADTYSQVYAGHDVLEILAA